MLAEMDIMSNNLLILTQKGENMLDYSEIKERLKDRNLAYVARKSGVSRDFLGRLVNNKIKRFPLEPYQLLNKYLEENK